MSSSRSENADFRAAFVKQDLRTVKSRRLSVLVVQGKIDGPCCESAFCLANILASASLDF